MTNINIFENSEFGEIRTVKINNEPYFVGNDIAAALEYARPREAITAHCNGAVTYRLLSNGGEQDTKVIPKGDVFRLIVKAADQSKSLNIKEKAKRFESWIFDEVLPSIHKYGAYMTPDTIEQVLLNPDTIINLATQLKNEQEERKRIELELREAEPKILHSNAVTASDDCISIGQLADILSQNGIDTGQNRLFDWLRERGYIEKRESYRINSKGKLVKEKSKTPTQRAMDLGLFKVQQSTKITPSCKKVTSKGEEVTKNGIRTFFTTKVTGKGQQYFVDKFLKHEVGVR